MEQSSTMAPVAAGRDTVAEEPVTAASKCPVDHVAAAAPVEVSKCPIDHTARAPECPMGHGGDRPAVTHSRADMFMRSLLRIRERPAGVTSADAYSTFQKSMLISATRCTLTYVVFPFVLPAAGLATGVGPVVGLVIGVVAIVCDVFTIRRFFAVDHRWRWHFTAIAVSVIGLLSVLLTQDIAHLLN